MHILVVDPNEAFATLLSEELKRQGYNVATCFDGDEALRRARRKVPDLALLDMALDRPDALVLARQLREIDQMMRLMLIPLMGEELSPKAQSVSVQGVLPKPFFLPELPERVEAALASPVEEMTAPPVEEEAAPVEEESPFLDLGPDVGELVEEVVEEPEDEDVGPISVTTAAAEPPAIPEEGGLSYDAFTARRADVRRLMNNLSLEVGADAVLLTMGEELIAWVGQLQQSEAVAVAQAVIHGWRTSAEVARILGREQVRFEQSIAGGDYMLYALSVERNAIMAVAIRGSAPLGLLRHRARGTAEQIAQLCVR